MGKIAKYSLFGFIAFLMFIAIAGVVITQMDPNRFKETIISKVNEQTGRDLALNGDIKLKYYPWLHLEINDLVFANAKDFKDQPFFQAESLQLRVKTLPLLKKNIEMDVFKVKGARIHVGKTQLGVPSWADLVKAPDDSAPAEQSKSGKPPAALGSILIGGIDIQNAALTWDDRSTGRKTIVRNLDLTTGNLVFGDPIDLKLSFSAFTNKPDLSTDAALDGQIIYNLDAKQYQVRPLTFDALLKGKNIPGGSTNIKLSSNIDLDLNADTASLTGLKLDALDTTLAGDVTAKALQSGSPAIDGNLTLNGTDISLPFKVAEIQPLAKELSGLNNKSFDMAVTFNTDLAYGNARLDRLDVKLLGADIRGNADIKEMTSTTPVMKGSFSAKGPDLPSLMQIAGTLMPKKDNPVKIMGSQLSALSQKGFDVNVDFDVDLKKGNIQIPTFAAKTLGLNLSGSASGNNINDPGSSLAGNLSFDGKNLTPLFNAINNKPLAQNLKSLSLQTTIIGKSGSFSLAPLKVDAAVFSKNKRKPIENITFSTQTHLNLEKQTATLQGLTLKGLGLNLNADVDATQILSNPSLQANIDIKPFNLKNLMARLNMKPIPTANKNVLKKVALKTSLSGSPQSVSLKNLHAKLDQSTITGSLDIKKISKPDLDFSLNIDTLNADHYLPPKQAKAKKKVAKKPQKTKPRKTSVEPAQLPLEQIRSLVANGMVTIGNLIISNAKLSNVSVTLDASNGIVQLSPVAADLYEGSYAGDIRLDATKKTPKLMLKGDLKEIQAEPMLTDLTGNSKLRGKGSVALDLSSTGNTPQQLISGLDGTMNFSFLDGALKGFNIGKFLRSVKSLRENRSFRVSEQEETDFAILTGNPIFKKGTITLDDLSGKSPAFRIQGNGLLADLIQNTIDYTASVTVVETSKGQTGADLSDLNGLTIPIQIKGNLQKPSIKPDIQSILASLATKRLSDKLGIKVPGLVPEQPSDQIQQEAPQQQKQPKTPEDVIKKRLEEEAGNLLRKLF